MENENKEKKKIRNFIKENGTVKKIVDIIKVNKPVRIAVTVLACLVMVGVSYTVYSKYYKTGYNNGMATASGFYFNSNYMASVDALRDMTPEKMPEIDQDILNSVIISSNENSWSGSGTYPFTVQIRNYDNQLLYNDKDLDVEYEVNFMLLGEPVGAVYSVAYGPGNQTEETLKWENGKSNVITVSGELPGGILSADDYTLRVTGRDGEYEPTDVLMVAYPVGPDFLQGTKAIAGILRANYQERPFDIAGYGFKICDGQGYQYPSSPGAWKDVILGESAYVYQLYTSGNFTGGAATRRTIKVKWRADMYKINYFDPYYQDVKDDDTKWTEETIDGHTYKVMSIDILPYASIKFTFFRLDDFENIINSLSDSDKEKFENSVQVELVDN